MGEIHLPHCHCDNENKIIKCMPSVEDCSSMADIFKQLSDGTRLRILWMLCHLEECVSNIAAAMEMSDPAVSHHLKQLKGKKHPIIVNEGRGPLICDEDLVWALDNGYIRGAALDMVESEDPDLDTCPLVGRDDVLLTPHSGYYSDTSNYLVAKLSMDNALYYVNGEYDKVKSIRNGVNA